MKQRQNISPPATALRVSERAKKIQQSRIINTVSKKVFQVSEGA